MQVLFNCPSCEQVRRAKVVAGESALTCGGCHWSRPFREVDFDRCGPSQTGSNHAGPDQMAVDQARPCRCLVCGCDDLWRQKDFPQRLGVAMVVLGAVLSTIAFALYMPLTALGVLLAFALVDLLLFTFMKDVLVCYRCHARYRDASLEDDYPRFNLETAERYRQEAARLDTAQADRRT